MSPDRLCLRFGVDANEFVKFIRNFSIQDFSSLSNGTSEFFFAMHAHPIMTSVIAMQIEV